MTADGATPGSASARFPGYDVLQQRAHWDAVTAGVVLGRLAPRAALRFFSAGEEATARALIDRLLGQDDDPRIPVTEMIDARLVDGAGDGYRHGDMPEDPETWRRSIAGLDADAGGSFAALDHSGQMAVIERVRQRAGDWHGMPAGRVFDLWMRYTCTAFYAHPWAWNEIGFGGPAYPRGYANLGVDRRERWERRERDARDPVPWAERTTAAKRAHAAGHGQPVAEERTRADQTVADA